VFRRVGVVGLVLTGLLGSMTAAARPAQPPHAHKMPCLATGATSSSELALEVKPKRCTLIADRSFATQHASPAEPAGRRAASSNVILPARAAFYYPWYPETWKVNHFLPRNHPTLGNYNSSARAVVDKHISWLDDAKVNVAIASWWGVGTHSESRRIPLLLSRTQALRSPLKWTVYYEQEGQGDPSVAQIRSDLAYLSSYAKSSSWAVVDGRPVIFVYGQAGDGCSMADRWKQAAAGWYVVLKVFPGYQSCSSQPDGWHQYSPAVAEDHRVGYSFSVSPGFWKADESSPRLGRDPARFRRDVEDMVASGEPWQLVTTFNEWGEGTQVEDAQGYGSTYRKILARNPTSPPSFTVARLHWKSWGRRRAIGRGLYRPAAACERSCAMRPIRVTLSRPVAGAADVRVYSRFAVNGHTYRFPLQ
jgi:hypothetical protein